MPRFAVLLTASLAFSTASAQTRYAPTVTQLPASARALALGDAFVGGRGSETIFYNASLLPLQLGQAVSVQRFGSASTSGAFSSTFGTTAWATGIGVQALDFGEGVAGIRATAPIDVRGPLASSSLAAMIATAGSVKGIRVGLAAKYVEERIGGSRDGAPAADIGLSKDIINRVTAGLSVQDIGGSIRLDGANAALPTRVTLGAAGFAPPIATWFDLAATAAVTYRRDGRVSPAGGVEINYVPLDGWAFTGHVGARRVSDRSDATPLTLGAGVSFDRLSLDYAFESLDLGGSSHRVGLRIR